MKNLFKSVSVDENMNFIFMGIEANDNTELVEVNSEVDKEAGEAVLGILDEVDVPESINTILDIDPKKLGDMATAFPEVFFEQNFDKVKKSKEFSNEDKVRIVENAVKTLLKENPSKILEYSDKIEEIIEDKSKTNKVFSEAVLRIAHAQPQEFFNYLKKINKLKIFNQGEQDDTRIKLKEVVKGIKTTNPEIFLYNLRAIQDVFNDKNEIKVWVIESLDSVPDALDFLWQGRGDIKKILGEASWNVRFKKGMKKLFKEGADFDKEMAFEFLSDFMLKEMDTSKDTRKEFLIDLIGDLKDNRPEKLIKYSDKFKKLLGEDAELQAALKFASDKIEEQKIKAVD